MAYEARKTYPGRKLWITNEIIHNPSVNGRLKEMGVGFIEADAKTGLKDFSEVKVGGRSMLKEGQGALPFSLWDSRFVIPGVWRHVQKT